MHALSRERIESVLTTSVFGRSLVYLPVAGSTNDVAKRLGLQGAREGTVVVADEQSAGRGRLSRRWLAPPATCILCSILLRPTLPPTQANWLTMLSSLAAADAIDQVAGLRVDIKWPNDLIVSSPRARDPVRRWKKLAGVLTESSVSEDLLQFVVVGLGINVNVSPGKLHALAPNATSVLAETGQNVDRAVLLGALLAGVERRCELLRTGESPRKEWAARLATLGRAVVATTGEGRLTGLAECVDEDGALYLRTADGELHRLLAGDVTLAS